MTPETNRIIDDDLRAAEPRMHEAVAKQVRTYISVDRLHETDAEIEATVNAVIRLGDLCGM